MPEKKLIVPVKSLFSKPLELNDQITRLEVNFYRCRKWVEFDRESSLSANNNFLIDAPLIVMGLCLTSRHRILMDHFSDIDEIQPFYSPQFIAVVITTAILSINSIRLDWSGTLKNAKL